LLALFLTYFELPIDVKFFKKRRQTPELTQEVLDIQRDVVKELERQA
jgi:hypothetical protein